MPLPEDINKAYETYYTHGAVDNKSAVARPSMRQRTAELCRSAYSAWRFNCGSKAGKPLHWLLALLIVATRIECDGMEIPLRYLAVPNKGRMLDVGCGDGWAVKLAKDLGWNAEGVDFDPQAVDTVRYKGLAVRLGSLADQRYPDDSFDLVLANHSIEHVHDPLATFAEAHRILRPGGSLVVTTPNSDSWGRRHFGVHWIALEPPRHLQLFNGKTLSKMTKLAGFAKVTLSSTLRTTSYIFICSRRFREADQHNVTRPGTWSEVLCARAAMFAEMLMRMREPLAANELLLEAVK